MAKKSYMVLRVFFISPRYAEDKKMKKKMKSNNSFLRAAQPRAKISCQIGLAI